MTHLIFPKNKAGIRMFVLFFSFTLLTFFYYRGIVVSIRRRGCFSDETHFLLPLHPSFAFVPPNVNVLIVSPQSISLRPLRPPPQNPISCLSSACGLRRKVSCIPFASPRLRQPQAVLSFWLRWCCRDVSPHLRALPPLARANGENHATGVHPSTKDRRLKKDMIRLHLMALVSRGR